MTFLDRAFSEIVQRNHNDVTDAISRNIDPFGAEYSGGVLAAFYVGGALFDNPKARAVAQDGLASTLIASGIITPSLKLMFGRSRHEQGQGPHDFDFFNPHYTSFPSGHTTQAFAVASVIATHYESIWVKATAYGAASIVGYARIQRNKHWARRSYWHPRRKQRGAVQSESPRASFAVKDFLRAPLGRGCSGDVDFVWFLRVVQFGLNERQGLVKRENSVRVGLERRCRIVFTIKVSRERRWVADSLCRWRDQPL